MKQCPWCDAILERREDESPSSFAVRQYCDRFHSARHIGDKLKVSKKPRKKGEGIFFRADPTRTFPHTEDRIAQGQYMHNRLEDVN